MKEIRLYGELGKRFGRLHLLAVNTAAEGIRALCFTIEGFEKALRDDQHGFKVWCGTGRIGDAERLTDPISDREVIRIAPVVSGSKSAIGRIITGIVLIAVAVVFAPATGGSSLSLAALATTAAFNVGVALVIGGVAELLTGSPKTKAAEDDLRKQSSIFNGAVNVTAQGNPVPIGYGRLMVGSVVISAALRTEDVITG